MNIALQKKQKKLKRFMDNKALEEQNAISKGKKSNTTKKTKNGRHRESVTSEELQNDLDRLSEIETIPDKIDYKKSALIPKYREIVKAYRDNGDNHANGVLVYLIIWLIDVELIEEAIELADLAIDQGQAMPERFKRDLPTYVAEEICTWAEKQYKAELSATPYLNQVAERLSDARWSVGQKIVLNKVYKLMALYAEHEKEWPQAIHWFEQCVACNPVGHGVKTKLDNAKRMLKGA